LTITADSTDVRRGADTKEDSIDVRRGAVFRERIELRRGPTVEGRIETRRGTAIDGNADACRGVTESRLFEKDFWNIKCASGRRNFFFLLNNFNSLQNFTQMTTSMDP
jgi:hypothetical protein